MSIDTPIIGSAPLPCYKEGDEATTVLEAHGSFVAWLADQIRLPTEEVLTFDIFIRPCLVVILFITFSYIYLYAQYIFCLILSIKESKKE